MRQKIWSDVFVFHYLRLWVPVDEGATDGEDIPNEWQWTRVYIVNGYASEESLETLHARIEK